MVEVGALVPMAWLIPVFPFLSFFLIVFIGKKMPKKGSEIGILAMLCSLGLSLAVFFQTISILQAPGGGDYHGYTRSLRWMDFGPEGFFIEAGFKVDGLAAVMLPIVCFVALLVHIYSTGYMKGDRRYTFFYAVLSLFTASMLNLVLANNLLQMLVGWEGVGVCSYLLIGHWWEEEANSNAAIKAFLTTRIGDVGFMFGIFVLFFAAGSFNVDVISEAVAAGNIAPGVITIAALLLFCGAVGKSAQFPLHVWLPDAMAGPTPVSALIHAATMVVAGVYLIARMFEVFHASAQALAVVAVIGAITMLIAGALALIQNDLKKVLAYSTISQLAYMIAGLGVSAYTASVFHIWTHAWFKALLFLGAGSVIHAVHSNNMSDMGGLRKHMPITAGTFIIGGLALAAFPPFAGFFSKDELVVGAYEQAIHGSGVGVFVFISMMVTAFMTACYVARMLALTFFGKEKFDHLHVHPHESPRSMTVPLILLCILSIGGGWVGIPGEMNLFGKWVHFGDEHAAFNPMIAMVSTGIALLGFATGWAIFARGKTNFDIRSTPLGVFYRMLENKYYLDDIYMKGIVRPIRDRLSVISYWINQNVIDRVVNTAGVATAGFGQVMYRDIDQSMIDGFVNGLAGFAGAVGEKLKFWQNGSVQRYAAALFLAVAVLVGTFVFLGPR
ncbi:MAG: NADH-quinone oxidoreductase subunit L [Actinomycetota bacterium]